MGNDLYKDLWRIEIVEDTRELLLIFDDSAGEWVMGPFKNLEQMTEWRPDLADSIPQYAHDRPYKGRR